MIPASARIRLCVIGALAVLALGLAGFNSNTYMVYGFIASSMIVWQHRDNIQRIRNGSERRLGHPANRAQGDVPAGG